MTAIVVTKNAVSIDCRLSSDGLLVNDRAIKFFLLTEGRIAFGTGSFYNLLRTLMWIEGYDSGDNEPLELESGDKVFVMNIKGHIYRVRNGNMENPFDTKKHLRLDERSYFSNWVEGSPASSAWYREELSGQPLDNQMMIISQLDHFCSPNYISIPRYRTDSQRVEVTYTSKDLERIPAIIHHPENSNWFERYLEHRPNVLTWFHEE